MHAVLDDTWDEATLSHENKPMPEAAILSSVPAASAGSVFEFDVTSAMIENGLASFAITSSVVDGCAYASRESATPPQLMLEFSAGASTSSATGGGATGPGTTGAGASSAVDDDARADDAGCACRAGGTASEESFWGLMGVAALAAGLRRRRRSSPTR